MDNSPLRRLSGELRNRIYELALHEPEGIPATIQNGRVVAARRNVLQGKRGPQGPYSAASDYSRPRHIGLTQTCKAIRQETLKLYFAINELTLYSDAILFSTRMKDGVATPLKKWAEMVGKEHVREIKRVAIIVGCDETRFMCPILLGENAGSISKAVKAIMNEDAQIVPMLDMCRMVHHLPSMTNPVRVDLDKPEATEGKIARRVEEVRKQFGKIFWVHGDNFGSALFGEEAHYLSECVRSIQRAHASGGFD